MDNLTTDIIRVFPRRTKWTPTDELAFVGEPKEPLLVPTDVPIHVSVTFTWDMERATKIASAWAQCSKLVTLSGPAFGNFDGGFVPGQYIKSGVTITSRGCCKNCAWCLVPQREGELREINIAPGYIVQDNNLLACSRPHIEAVFDMLRQQSKGAVFAGGLDIDYLEPWHVELLKSISVHEIWVSCDCDEHLGRLDKAVDLLSDFSIEKKRCYVLVGYGGETAAQAERRLEAVYGKGFLPFAQPYKAPDAEFAWCTLPDPQGWNKLVRKWCRPALYRRSAGSK